MALPAIRSDLFGSVKYADTRFQLISRQEMSRQASGATRGKDLGPAIWVAEFTTVALALDDAIAFEADLNSLDGVIGRFYGHDIRRPYPRAYRSGVFNDTGQIAALGGNNKSLSLKSLPANFLLSKGDRLAFDYLDANGETQRALHEVSEAATANGSGTTTAFEVRPLIRPGAAVNAAITLKKPAGLFTLVEAYEPRLEGEGGVLARVSFRAAQY